MTPPETLWFGNTVATIHVPSAEGADGICLMEHRLPFDDASPLHVHHSEDELFYILEGRMRFVVGGKRREVGPGEALLAPQGAPHSFRVLSAEGARMLVVTRGAGFETLVRGAGRGADQATLPEPAVPSPEMQARLAALAAENDIAILGAPAA